nr:hypothetical protein MACL_00000250 [Theileria orientalis]
MSIVSFHNYIYLSLVYLLISCTISVIYRSKNGSTHYFSNATSIAISKHCFLNSRIPLSKQLDNFFNEPFLTKTGDFLNNDVVYRSPETGFNGAIPKSKRDCRLFLSRRAKINRFNKEKKLFQLVRERRKKYNDRFVDIRKINFRNSRCNLQLLRLPVSPLVDLNSIVPFKTVLNMREEIPFNPTPLLRNIGFRFKPLDPDRTIKVCPTGRKSSNDSEGNSNFYIPGRRKYERFCEPYPMDRLLEIMDARSCGYYSRMGTDYMITGESDDPPTPMMGQIVPPGGSVGKGAGFGLGKKKSWKEPVPLSELKSHEKDEKVDKFERQFRSDEKQSFKIPLDEPIEDEKLKQIIREAFPEDIVENSGDAMVDLPYLDDVCDEGDIFRNPRYLGEYRYKYWFHPFYGSPAMPSDAKKIIDEYNKKNPDDQVDYERDFLCDLIYCHSNGTIVELREDVLPYDPSTDDVYMDGEDPREPRFVIYCERNYIKEHGLKKGQIFEQVNEENRKLYFDNIFFQPKSLRHPVHLPDGSLYQENFIPKQRR